MIRDYGEWDTDSSHSESSSNRELAYSETTRLRIERMRLVQQQELMFKRTERMNLENQKKDSIIFKMSNRVVSTFLYWFQKTKRPFSDSLWTCKINAYMKNRRYTEAEEFCKELIKASNRRKIYRWISYNQSNWPLFIWFIFAFQI